MRVRTLNDFRRCLAIKQAAANEEKSYDSRQRDKRRRLTMPPPLNVVMRSRQNKYKLEALKRDRAAKLEEENGKRAWYVLCF